MDATLSNLLSATKALAVTAIEAQPLDKAIDRKSRKRLLWPSCSPGVFDVARGQVFHTTELLELILTGLDPIDLIRTQRVCKKWQAVIESSDVLQRKLFYKANACERVIFVSNRMSEVVYPTLHSRPIRNKKKTYIPRGPRGHWDLVNDAGTKADVNMRANPFIDRIIKCGSVKFSGFFFCHIFMGEPVLLYNYGPFKLDLSSAHNGESWKDTLLTAPPVASIGVFIKLGPESSLQGLTIKMQDGIGVRMRDLVDALWRYK